MTNATSFPAEVPVVVIGGGPAGSTVSTLIAEPGIPVVLFEREHFPRFHIGESLIPETYWVLKRLGMLDKMKQSHFVKKHSVQFVKPDGRLSEPFYFHDHKPHECSQTWQVVRSEFDQMLLDNAREHGVEVHEGVRVLEVLFRRERAVGVRVAARGRRPARGAGQSRGRCQRPERHAAQPLQTARMGSGAQQGSPLDVLEGRLPRHGARRRRDDRACRRKEAGLVLVHPAAQQHRQRGGRRGFRLPVQEPRRPTKRSILRSSTAVRKSNGGSPRATRCDRASTPPRTTRTARNKRPATAGSWSATPSDFSTRFIRPACCWPSRSGQLAADAIAEGLAKDDTSAAQLGKWGPEFKQGMDRMRRLVCEYYEGFSFGRFVKKNPDQKGHLTDLLIGDLFKEGFSTRHSA